MAGIFTLPRSQSLRFIDKSQLVEPQNYDNRFAYRLEYFNTLEYYFCQKFLNTDTVWIQYRTDYESVDVDLVDEYNNITSLNSYKQLLFTDSSGRSYYNVIIPTASLSGKYFIELSGTQDVDKSIFLFQSESLFEIVNTFEYSLLLEWRGNDFAYPDSIDWSNHELKQCMRLFGRDRELLFAQSKTVYNNSNYSPVNLKAKPIRNVKLEFSKIPYWIIEKIGIALCHDEFYSNKVKYNTDEDIEHELINDSQMYEVSIVVTDVNFENGEDVEMTGDTPVVVAELEAYSDTENVAYNDTEEVKYNN